MAKSKTAFIQAHFATEPLPVLKKFDSRIFDAAGTVFFEMKGVEAPSHWSQLAVDIAAAKFLRKTGVPKTGHETSIPQMIDRVTKSIAKFGQKKKYFKSKKEADLFRKELTAILLNQRAFFNSPVWFNCGLWEAYKIKGDLPLYHWEKGKIQTSKNSFANPQVSACFILSLDDSLEGIFELAKTEALLFKFGSGTGTNFSSLRSKYEDLSGGGTSSGLISFLEVLDRGAGSIKSGGTTRRAAKMVLLDVDHPEIFEFAQWKASEERKAKALIAAGYGDHFEQEAYKTVSGQNSNNSVRVSDEFMQALAKDQDWDLKAPTSGETVKTAKAKDIWQTIAESAWACADPGVQFSTTINQWHTCRAAGTIRASNPCSEYLFLDDSACNLSSLNLLKFLDEKNQFDLKGFIHTARVMFLAQEILIDLAGYPTEKVAQNSHDFRPLGLGFCGLGAFLMQQGIAYDSEQGRTWAGGLASLLTGTAYQLSAEMAAELGPYAGYKKNKASALAVLKMHAQAQADTDWAKLPAEISIAAENAWRSTQHLAQKKGLRNAQVSVMAPTGTIGLVMDCDTTGIEPEFSLLKTKKLSGGGEVSILSQSFEKALQTLGYTQTQRERIVEFVKKHGTLNHCEWIQKQHRRVFDCAMDISAEGHLLMMAAIQPFVSGAISKTVNLPETASVADVAKTYERAWHLGLKSVALYRNRSKGVQPLAVAQTPATPKCVECGSDTELAGGCFRCVNCGSVIGCA